MYFLFMLLEDRMTELKKRIFVPIPKRKPRSDTEVCCICNKRHKLENISSCWENECENMKTN